MNVILKGCGCDKCLGNNVRIEKVSTVGEGMTLLLIGLATSFLIIGIPLAIWGLIKLIAGYKYRVYCTTCGYQGFLSKGFGEKVIIEHNGHL